MPSLRGTIKDIKELVRMAYKIEYGISENRIKAEIEKGVYLMIGVFSRGSNFNADFNAERAYRHLNGLQERPQEARLSFTDFKRELENKGSW